MKNLAVKSLVIVLLCLVSCAPKVEHVFLIGLDGLSSEAYRKGDMPFVQSLGEIGISTTKKRAVYPSASALNWASMFMGAPIEIHGYTTWGSKTPEIESRVLGDNNIFPTIFQLTRKAYPESEIGVIYDWDGIKYIVDTLSLNYHAKTASLDPVNVATMASAYVKDKKPFLAAFIFDNPDHVGHTIGWESEDYRKVISRQDSCIREIVRAIDEAGIRETSVIIVSSDHGGIEQRHGGTSLNEMETPLIIEGPGIPKGVCLDDVSLMQYDVASTILDILHIQQPQACTGRSVLKYIK